MKRRRTATRRTRTHATSPSNAGILFLLPALAVLTFFAGTHFAQPVQKIAMLSASLALPQGTAEVIRRDWTTEPPAPETTDAPPTEATTEPPVVLPAAAAITDTPQDILDMIAAAQATAAQAEKSGNIVEKQYDAANANAVWKNVTVRNTTPSHSIDIAASIAKPATISIQNKADPTVLIFHTHTTESYETLDNGWYSTSYVTRSTDPQRNMVRVGTAICEELEKAGIGVVHDREIHDTKYTGAYDRSRASIEKILKEHPTIQVVLDVHRDAIQQNDGTRIKPTATINGKKAAQIMIIAGCEDGKVKSFPTWEQNLTFALQLQQIAETKYPGLMRPILFSARKYNMDITPCSVLLEMGSDSNTLQEAEYAGRLVGTAIAQWITQNTA